MKKDDNFATTGSPVTDFVQNTLTQIRAGVKGANGYVKGMVEFDLEITEKKEKGAQAGFKQFIVVGGKKEGQSVQRVKFNVDIQD